MIFKIPWESSKKLMWWWWFALVAESCLTLVTSWSVASQAPLSMGFSRQEYWSALPFPSPEALPNPRIKSRSLELQADSLPTELYLGFILKYHQK